MGQVRQNFLHSLYCYCLRFLIVNDPSSLLIICIKRPPFPTLYIGLQVTPHHTALLDGEELVSVEGFCFHAPSMYRDQKAVKR